MNSANSPQALPIIDCHVHICATTPGHGFMSEKLQNSLAFRFMRWRLKIEGSDERTERQLEALLADLIEKSSLDAAVVLAFDAVHDQAGNRDDAQTSLYVTNDYVIKLRDRHPKMLFGASVHPYRRDAVAEIERCVAAGAVLMKWLPPVQNFDPSDARCIPFYEALAHDKLPLLCHTGGEQSLPTLNPHVADPTLLIPALDRGVTVIMAHCGTRSRPFERSFLPDFIDLVKKYPNCFGDTAALNLPTRSYAYRAILSDPLVREKIIHGSDWPILPVPPMTKIGARNTPEVLREMNWIERDIQIKKRLGFDEGYWHRAARVLRGAKEISR